MSSFSIRGDQFGMHGHPTSVPFVRAARDPGTASRLWDVSVQLTGVGFDALEPPA